MENQDKEKTKDTRLALRYQGTEIGHAIVREYEDGEKFLADFSLDPYYRNRGLGQKFLSRMIGDYGVNSLTVGVSNDRARHIYDKFGFKAVLGPYYDKNSQETVYYMKRGPEPNPPEPEGKEAKPDGKAD